MSRGQVNGRASPVTFRFSEIGPVKDASLQLGRLTVIAGRNNTGKTYLTYSLYGFLKSWSHWPETEHILKAVPAAHATVGDLAAKLRRGEEAKARLSASEVLDHRRLVAEELGVEFSKHKLRHVFSSRQANFRASRVGVEIGERALDQPPTPVAASFGRHVVSIRYDGDILSASMQSRGLSQVAEPKPGKVRSRVAQSYVVFLLRDLLPEPFVLPAERFGVSLFYRELDFSKNQLLDMLQKLGDEGTRRHVSPYQVIDRNTSRYALPIKDNIDFARRIPDLREGSELASHKLFGEVKDLIDGYYGNATDDIRFISKARGKGRSFNIPLHLASASARALADLYFFFKHVARQGQLLIIDEPESHLDARNQILFARLLSRLVASGLHVLVTTHSDYLIKELNNLILLARDFPEKQSVAKKLGYRPGEGLNAELVRAYVAEDGGLTECELDAYGINMPFFDRIIDDINKASMELTWRATADWKPR